MKLKTLLLFLIALTLVKLTQATHYVGSEITYKCLNAQGDYEVTLILYRDCGPGTATFCNVPYSEMGSCSMPLDVWGADPVCASTRFFTINCKCVSVRDIYSPKLCAGLKTTCTNLGKDSGGILSPAFERYEFKGLVNIGSSSGIPVTCCNIRFSYSNCCRNNIIQNITPGSFYSEAIVNRCLVTFPNANSVAFANDPLAFINGNENIEYNSGAYDVDGDSLAYKFTPLMESFGVTCTYVTPYTYYEPFPANKPFELNPITGQLSGICRNIPYAGVYAIKVEQWRKINNTQKLVGVVTRNIDYRVFQSLFNKSPLIEVNSSTSNDAVYICAQNKICFDVMARDSDLLDSTIILPDTFMKIYGVEFLKPAFRSRQDKVTICWKPHDSLIREAPYTFSLLAEDNHCPIVGRAIKNIRIYVRNSQTSPMITTSVSCGKSEFNSNVPGNWNLSDDTIYDVNTNVKLYGNSVSHTYFKEGKHPYSVAFNVAGCSVSNWDTISINHTVDFRINNDTIICGGSDSLTLQLKNIQNGLTYSWFKLPDTTNAISSKEKVKIYPSNSSKYLLKLMDGLSCVYNDTFILTKDSFKIPEVSISSAPYCQGKLFTYWLNADSNKYQYQWKYEGQTIIGPSCGFYSLHPGTNTVVLYANFVNHCFDSTKLTVNVTPKGQAPIMTDTSDAFEGIPATYHVKKRPGVTHHWLTDTAEIVKLTDSSITVLWGGLLPYKTIAVWYDSICSSDTTFRKINFHKNNGLVEEESIKLIIYPQPSKDVLFLKGELEKIQSAILIGIDGKIEKIFIKEEISEGKLQLNDSSSGIYFLEIRDYKNNSLRRKVIILK